MGWLWVEPDFAPEVELVLWIKDTPADRGHALKENTWRLQLQQFSSALMNDAVDPGGDPIAAAAVADHVFTETEAAIARIAVESCLDCVLGFHAHHLAWPQAEVLVR